MPSECAAVIKADGYGCGIEQVAATLAKAGCKTFFVADLAEARRVRAVAPEPAIYVLNGLLPGTAAAYADMRARPVIGSMVELAEWDAFVLRQPMAWRRRAACRHRHEPARHLGQRRGGAGAAHPRRKPRHHAADEPPRLLRESRSIRSTSARSRCSAKCACSIAASPPRSPIRPAFSSATAAHCDMVRPGVALYGVNPTPGQQQSDAPGDRIAGAHRAGAHRAARRDRRLRRRLDRQARDPHRGGRGRLCRRLSARGQRVRRGAGRRRHRRRPALPAGRAASPWTCWRSTSPTCPTAPSGAAISSR